MAKAKLALTLEEAAESITVSINTMRALIYQPGFPAFRVGRRWVIPVDAFNAWLCKQGYAKASYPTACGEAE